MHYGWWFLHCRGQDATWRVGNRITGPGQKPKTIVSHKKFPNRRTCRLPKLATEREVQVETSPSGPNLDDWTHTDMHTCRSIQVVAYRPMYSFVVFLSPFSTIPTNSPLGPVWLFYYFSPFVFVFSDSSYLPNESLCYKKTNTHTPLIFVSCVVGILRLIFYLFILS